MLPSRLVLRMTLYDTQEDFDLFQVGHHFPFPRCRWQLTGTLQIFLSEIKQNNENHF